MGMFYSRGKPHKATLVTYGRTSQIRSTPRMRVAVVDIGTNSTRVLVADVDDNRLTELDRRTTVTRLGEGLEATGRLSDDAMGRVSDALAELPLRDRSPRRRPRGRRRHQRHARRLQRPGLPRRDPAPLRPRRPHHLRRRGGPPHLPRRHRRPPRGRGHARDRHRRRQHRVRHRRARQRPRLPCLHPHGLRPSHRAPPARRPARRPTELAALSEDAGDDHRGRGAGGRPRARRRRHRRRRHGDLARRHRPAARPLRPGPRARLPAAAAQLRAAAASVWRA